MPRKILILTQEFDPVADRLIVVLRRKGADCLRWHQDSVVSASSLNISISPSGLGASFTSHGKTIALHEIQSVWNRRPAPFPFPDSMTNDERIFAEREVKAALALWSDHVRTLIEGGERKIVPMRQVP